MQSDTPTTPALPAGVREGGVVAGKYLIEKIIGSGAVGVIVSARHLLLDERIAIKFLLPQAMGTGDAVKRFVQEARASVRMRSEYTVRVTDVALLESGSPYIVMEYLEGKDLAALVTQGGPLTVERSVEFVLQACEALAEAHASGIVHRDLKPANLFVVERADGTSAIKVLDFGISKMRNVEHDGVGLTNKNVLLGSPLYMSPEQMESSTDVDARTDIWALGVVLFEILTGDVPYAGDSLPQLYAKILSNPPIPFPDGEGRLPLLLEEVIRTCLAKDRDRRYGTIRELALALAPLASVRGLSSVRRLSVLARTWTPATSSTPWPPDSSNATSSNAMPRPATASVGEPDASRSGRATPRGGSAGGRALAAGGIAALIAGGLLIRAAPGPSAMRIEIDSTKPPVPSEAKPEVTPAGLVDPVAVAEPPAEASAPKVDASAPSKAPPGAPTPAPPAWRRPAPPHADLPKSKDERALNAHAVSVEGTGAPTLRPALPGALSGSD